MSLFQLAALFLTPTSAVGGLHGALSPALVLSIRASPHRPLPLTVTYVVVVVVFSVASQALTFGPLVSRLNRGKS